VLQNWVNKTVNLLVEEFDALVIGRVPRQARASRLADQRVQQLCDGLGGSGCEVHDIRV
jgi:hypothetical protein